ncbi:MAG TPA: ABC transporter permease, partial [Burkholderiaceae bacterium]|nr:ABC transporter permease [Burkholderiaceae bacterium]
MATTRTLTQRAVHDWLPVAVVLLSVVIAWYGAAWALNAPGAIERVLDAEAGYTQMELFEATMTMERPLMPAPHQVAMDFYESLTEWPVDSPRNLIYHVIVTGQSTLLGFVMGTALGLLLSVLIVHSRTLDKALLPWIVASQTVPVLAIAPIVLVV